MDRLRKLRLEAAARREAIRLRDRMLLDDLGAGRISESKLSEMRQSVLSGDCPLCGRSGFVIIAHHVARVHGVESRRLRDLLGFTYVESICNAEVSARYTALNAERGFQVGHKPFGEPTSNREMSRAGRKKLALNAIAINEKLDPERLKEIRAKNGRASLSKLSKAELSARSKKGYPKTGLARMTPEQRVAAGKKSIAARDPRELKESGRKVGSLSRGRIGNNRDGRRAIWPHQLKSD